MQRYFVWTIGCQMNKAESQSIAAYLESAGYRATKSFTEADLVVLNTCVVRQSAEDKVLGTLGFLKGLKKQRPNLYVLVTGCFVNSDVGGLEERFPQVDLFFPPGAFDQLANWAQRQGISPVQGGAHPPGACSPCALVPIIQGCDNFCSYCIVPYRRGRQVSRPLEQIVQEVRSLVERGVKEVTLLGQTVDSYGHDLPDRPDLADLLAWLNSIDGLARIRFLTNYPKDMNAKLIEAVASFDKVCEYLELPVQSGDNDVLDAMRRGYSVEEYRDLVRDVRRRIPGVSLSTDVIVGFPGETERQYEHTLSLLEAIEFDVVHVAAYSPRPGTISWRRYDDDVSREVKMKRLRGVEQLQVKIGGAINSRLRGEIVEVLVEGKKKGKCFGRSRGNKLVFFEEDTDCLGQSVGIRIHRASPWALQGSIDDGHRERRN